MEAIQWRGYAGNTYPAWFIQAVFERKICTYEDPLKLSVENRYGKQREIGWGDWVMRSENASSVYGVTDQEMFQQYEGGSLKRDFGFALAAMRAGRKVTVDCRSFFDIVHNTQIMEGFKSSDGGEDYQTRSVLSASLLLSEKWFIVDKVTL